MLPEEYVSSGYLARLWMQVDGRKEAGESCTSEVMTTWCRIQQSTTEIVMEKPELSPRVQLCMDPSVCLCICD